MFQNFLSCKINLRVEGDDSNSMLNIREDLFPFCYHCSPFTNNSVKLFSSPTTHSYAASSAREQWFMVSILLFPTASKIYLKRQSKCNYQGKTLLGSVTVFSCLEEKKIPTLFLTSMARYVRTFAQ